MIPSERRRRRIRDVKTRVKAEDNNYLPRCTVSDPVTGKACGRPTARAAKNGLSAFVCRYHQQHKQRHGSHWCKSPSASLLRPYRLAARQVMASHENDPFVQAALRGFSGLLATAGPVETASRLRGLPPERRAKIALARLRQAGTPPARFLEICLGVSALVKDAPATVHRTHEYKIVAIAKSAFRLASGTHKRWEIRDDAGKLLQTTEMHIYPRSSGRVLRYLGEMLHQESELVIDKFLHEVVAAKI